MAEAQAINATARVESRIRLAAALICAGLLVLLFTLIRIHPLAFVAFAVIGCPAGAGGNSSRFYFRLCRTSLELKAELAPNQRSHRMLVQRNIRSSPTQFQNTSAGRAGISQNNHVLPIRIFKSRMQYVAAVALRVDAVRAALDKFRVVRKSPILSAVGDLFRLRVNTH